MALPLMNSTSSQPSSQPSPPTDTAPMFGNNNAIMGGTFTLAPNIFYNAEANTLELLQREVATAAFHNSAQRVDPPKCHPDTRIEVLQTLYDWINQSEQREEWLLWLSGAAGAGKSAIIQSIAERCVREAIAIASFFFLRSDPTRNTVAPLVVTLAYQLIQAIPETSTDILPTVKKNPLIFQQSFELQLKLLIIQPLLRLPQHLQRLFVVFIDGLDEITDQIYQSHLIKVLGDVSSNRDLPVAFMVSSRREPQIEAAFGQKPVAALLRALSLDAINARDDIRRFLDSKFQDIKETHLRKHLLPNDWPAPSVFNQLVDKASGQFIFAHVVINYISSPRAIPSAQLDIVRGIRIRNPSKQNPFAHLDALYQHIFSQVEALDEVLDIIAYIFISREHAIETIQGTFLMEPGELDVLFADLAPVIRCETHLVEIKFHHKSLHDFLTDKNRSDRYHIDINEYKIKLLCRFIKRPSLTLDSLSSDDDIYEKKGQERMRVHAIIRLLPGAKASEQLRGAIMEFNCIFYSGVTIGSVGDAHYDDFLLIIKYLNFNDQGEAYRHVEGVLFASRSALKAHPSASILSQVPDSINIYINM